MATRTVTVRLRADINQYTRGMRTAANSTSRLAGAGAAVGTAMITGFAVAAASAAKFDKELSNVRAVTGASAAQMGKLRAAALEAGKTTVYSASEAAKAEAELARAGVSVADITGGALKGSLALAASGQIDLAEAATLSAQAMNTFGLKGKDVTHVADVLSAGANKSAADVHGLGMALRMGGLLAHQTGLSIEETVGTLSAFADHALIGSDAGTSLKVMLQRLVPQSDEAQAAMDAIGFSAYDSTGKFVGLSELAGRMKTSFSKLTPEARNSAMATIFGADAVRSATILYELGSDGINKYTKSVNDHGAAGRIASIQTDNLIGDLERLRGAIEVALIEGGSAANGTLRTMTQWITKVVDAYNSLPPELQRTVTGLTGVGGAVLLVVSGILLLLPRIAATRAALVSMGVTAARTRAVMLGLGRMTNVVLGIAAIGYGVSKMVGAFQAAPPNITRMKAAMVDFAQSGKVSGELARNFGKDLDGVGDAVARIAHPSGLKRTKDFFSTFDPFNDTDLDVARTKIKGIDDSLTELVQSGNADIAAENFKAYAAAAQQGGTSTEKFRSLLHGYSNALVEAGTNGKLSAGSQKDLAEQAGITADQLKDQRTEAEKLSDALKTLNGASISAAEGEIGFRQSLADLNTAVKENGHSLDISTDKGRKVKGAFLDAAKAAMQHAEAVAEQKNSQEAGQRVLEKDIGLLKKDMLAKGFSKDAVNRLAAAYLTLPASVSTEVDMKTAGAMADLEAVKKKVASTKGKTIKVDTLTKEGEKNLEGLGFKIKRTKGKGVIITVPTGSQKRNVDALVAAIRALHDKSITITTKMKTYKSVQSAGGSNQAAKNYYETSANGRVYYANGGMRENHVAQIAKAGTWRVWAEDETGGEAYIPLAASKRPRSRRIAAETVRRLGGQVQWYAGGGIPGFTYTPGGPPVLGGTGDAKQRVDKLVGDLRNAWKEYNDAVKELNKVRKDKKASRKQRAAAEKKVRDERADIADINEKLGQSKYAKAPTSFNMKNYVTQLNKSVAATEKWQKSLAKIGARGGEDIRALLESMGEDGYNLVNQLAGASDKQFKDIVSKLQKVGGVAKATLADFNKQLGASTKENQQFAADLQKLAAQGFGDLAQALAAQGDPAAMALAHEAAGNSKSAAAANKTVGAAQHTLTGEDLANSLILLSTLRGKTGAGYAELIEAGLDTATIKDLVPKMLAQINALPASYKEKFLQQWAGQNGGVAMARGGVLTRPTMVLGGEAGVAESWIPHDGSARSRQLLAVTARRLGFGLVPASRYASAASSAAAGAGQMGKNVTVNLNGARQTSAEQAMDVARHLTLIG